MESVWRRTWRDGSTLCFSAHRLDFCRRSRANSSPLIPLFCFFSHNNWKLLCAVNYPVRLRKAPIISVEPQQKEGFPARQKVILQLGGISEQSQRTLFQQSVLTFSAMGTKHSELAAIKTIFRCALCVFFHLNSQDKFKLLHIWLVCKHFGQILSCSDSTTWTLIVKRCEITPKESHPSF